jgi:F420-non-reducing hydrogenase iron-sulfur subunit
LADEFKPNIIGIFCRWCSYTAADLAGTARIKMPPTTKIVRVMCSSRVDPVLVISTLLDGADGVLVAGCAPGDCHYVTGNLQTRRRFVLLKEIFETLGMDTRRVTLSWIPASEGPKVKRVVTEVTESLQEAGPNPTREEMFI